MKALKDTGEWTVVHYIRQACAALTINEIVSDFDNFSKDFLIDEIICRKAVGLLLFALSNRKFAEAQRNASIALYALSQRIPNQRDVSIYSIFRVPRVKCIKKFRLIGNLKILEFCLAVNLKIL